MDPSYASSDDEAEAMAKAMGFSSFGTQGPAKKRKFNSSTDAMVEGQELAALQKGGKKGQGSGGKYNAFGEATSLGCPTVSNMNEIDLDEEDEEDRKPDYVNTSLPPPRETGGIREGENEEVDAEPVHIDTSPASPGEDLAAQQKIDAILAHHLVPSVPPDSKANFKPQLPTPNRGVGQFMGIIQDIPQPPPPGVSRLANTNGSFANSERPRERGQRNELWYVDYYDPSFNENPWSSLEKSKGLPPKGTWIERGGHRAGTLPVGL